MRRRALSTLLLAGALGCAAREPAPPPPPAPAAPGVAATADRIPDFQVEADRAFMRLPGGGWAVAIAVPGDEDSLTSTLRLNEAGIDVMRRVGCADHVLTPLPSSDHRAVDLAARLGDDRLRPARLYASVECLRR